MRILMFLFLFIGLIFVTNALPALPPQPPAVIVKSNFELHPEGAYEYGFESNDGIAKEELGSIKILKDEKGKDEPTVVSRGSYSYIDPEGNQIVLTYIADENGFQPQGSHLPTI